MNHKVIEDKKIVVKGKEKFKLKNFSSVYNAGYGIEKEIKEILEDYKNKISKLQDKLYAENKHSVLIILQAIDAAGKDSCIKHVMSGINPQGCDVTSFKQPSKQELQHDFLWRTNKVLPEKGKIGIFNRSYYEEVLVTKVHPEFILGQNIPKIDDINKVDEKFWKNRYRAINEMERHLTKNGTVIIKIFLNMSKAEQKTRFMERIVNPDKNWKFSYADIKERAFWPKYQQAYQDMITETSTKYAPWYIVPADNQWVSRALVGDILLETLESLNLKYPTVNAETKAVLLKAKTELV